jgi:hypothetical protein
VYVAGGQGRSGVALVLSAVPCMGVYECVPPDGGGGSQGKVVCFGGGAGQGVQHSGLCGRGSRAGEGFWLCVQTHSGLQLVCI